MKKLLLLSIFTFGLLHLTAQNNCDNRYITEIFSDYTLTSDVVYGNNTTLAGNNQDLLLDFYEPTGDNLAVRPLILLVHGFPGDKTDENIVHFCEKFVKRGFVVASANTTLIDVFTSDTLVLAEGVVRGTFDFKAAIRYFKQDYATANVHRVDTAQIFGGGFSWGGLLGMSAAYLDLEEYYPDVQAFISETPGGVDGNSGNPGYSSSFQGVVSMAGQIPDAGTLSGPSPVPIISIHGTADNVSPYYHGLNSGGVTVDGSARIHEYATSINLMNQLITIPSGGHYDFYDNLIYRDSTEILFAEFIYRIMKLSLTIVDY